MYEITDALYLKFVESYAFYEKVKSHFCASAAEVNPCLSCEFYINDLCDFRYPEAGTSKAADCSMFQKREEAAKLP